MVLLFPKHANYEEVIDFGLLSSNLGVLLFTFSRWPGELLKCYR